ncbi:DUF4347 domain-containing protein [Phaeobacter inhibens]|uniref:DUF4347 domain-containing protein n=1 Tax=Phaeobacter inhibens TaxID=221822 RepID=UPI0021A5F8D6|nr:DUF4347 domain-containing protein [Phaeobacter inhibens]UWR47293.1 DUF4347 domain-containing protein [Phaeobacter inhibens]
MTDIQVFVFDPSVEQYQTLLLDLPEQAKIVLLDSDKPGLAQIADALRDMSGLSALHVVSHGDEGRLFIGNEVVTKSVITANPEVMEVLGKALFPNGDILLYGCKVAATAQGEAFVTALAEATSANVAASQTLTGAAELGGDWTLGLQRGAVTTPVGVSATAQTQFSGVLSTVLSYSAYSYNGSNKADWVDGSDGIADFPGIALTLDYGDGTEGANTFTNMNIRGVMNMAVGAVLGGNVGSTDGTFFNNDSNGFQLSGDGDFSFEGFTVIGRGQSLSGDTFTIRGFNSSGTEVVTDSLDWGASGANVTATYSIGSGSWDSDAAWASVRTVVVDYSNDPSFQEFAVVSITVDAATPSNVVPALGGAPADETATEDVATTIDLSAYNVSDADGDTITLTLAVDRGTIASTDGNGVTGGVTVANSGTGSMTLQGSAATLNTYLNDTTKIEFTARSNDTTTATLTVTPSDGTATGTADTISINVTSVNDAPTLVATGGNPTYVEGATASDLFNTVTASTVESGEMFTGLTLTVTNVSDGAAEVLNFDGSQVTLTHGFSATTATNGLSVTVSLSGTTATVSFSGASLSAAGLQTLVDGLSYQNTSDDPTTSANRVVTLTETTDSGGTANGGDDSAALSLASTVSITAVNDAPVLSNLSGDNASLLPGTVEDIDAGGNTTLTNADSADYNGGFLLITDNGSNNTANGGFAVDGTTVTSGADATIAVGEIIAVNGVSIGTVHATDNGQGGNDLRIDFGANATNATIQSLIQNLTWGAATGSGQQTFTLTLNDNDGTANGGDQDVSVDFSMSIGNKPVIANLSGDTVAFVENGGDVALDTNADATVSDADGGNFNSGSLTVAFQSGQTAHDRIVIDTSANVALSAGQTAGSTVTVQGVMIGALAAGSTGGANENLVVDLNTNATPARVQALITELSYNNTSDEPNTANRTLGVTIVDDVGITSDTATVTVTVAATDDAPTLSATGTDPNFIEGGTAMDLFHTVSADTIESGQTFTELRLTITNLADGSAEILKIDGSALALTDANTLTTATNSLSATVSVTGTTATVTLTSGTMSSAAVQTLVDAITYQNTSEDPTNASNRVVTITGLTDSGSATGSNENSATLSLASTVTVSPVNDAPVVDAVFAEAASQIVLGTGFADLSGLNDAAVSNLDSDDYQGGSLTIQQTSGTANGSWGVDGTLVTSDGDAVIAAGQTVQVNGVTVGTIDPTDVGANGGTLTINFTTGSGTSANVQTLLQNLTYSAPSASGTRTFDLTLNDNDGSTNGGDQDVSGTFDILVVSSPPVIGNLDGDSFTFTEGDNATPIDVGDNLTVSDPDDANFDQGTVTISYESGMQPEDRISVDVSGVVSLSAGLGNGSVVSVSGVTIGTVSATGTGGAGEDLVINLTAGATHAAMQSFLSAIQYDNTSVGAPTDGNREIGVRIVGGDGAISDLAVITINVDPASSGGGSSGGTPAPVEIPMDVSAGDDNDTFSGTNYNDTINGGGGNDRITGDRGEDLLHGGKGVDTLRGGDGDDRLFLGSGNDRGVAGAGNDQMNGGGGNDMLHGGQGDDTLRGGQGADRVYGGQGSDSIRAGQGNDTVFGGSGADRVRGDLGNDQISLGIDDDRAFGGSGDDSLAGGDGEDTLNGGMGDDLLRGGAGRDTFIFASGRGNDRISDFNVQDDQLNLRGFSFTDREQALAFGMQSDGDFIFSFEDGSTLTLHNISLADLNEAVFLF